VNYKEEKNMKKIWLAILVFAVFLAAGIPSLSVAAQNTAYQKDNSFFSEEDVSSILGGVTNLIQSFNAEAVYDALKAALDMSKLFGFWETPYFENIQNFMITKGQEQISNFAQEDYLEQLIAKAYADQNKPNHNKSSFSKNSGFLITGPDSFEIQMSAKGTVKGNHISLFGLDGTPLTEIDLSVNPTNPNQLIISGTDMADQSSKTYYLEISNREISLDSDTDSIFSLRFKPRETILIEIPSSESEVELAFDKKAYRINGTVSSPEQTMEIELELNPLKNLIALALNGTPVIWIESDPVKNSLDLVFADAELLMEFDDDAHEILGTFYTTDQQSQFKLICDKPSNSLALDMVIEGEMTELFKLAFSKQANGVSLNSAGGLIFSATIDEEKGTMTINDSSGFRVLDESQILDLINSSIKTGPEAETEVIDNFLNEEEETAVPEEEIIPTAAPISSPTEIPTTVPVAIPTLDAGI
jgi:hypothetical protein